MKRVVQLTISVALALTLASCEEDRTDGARSIPDQYGFPAEQLELLKLLDEIDFISMRKHAWTIWAGLTHQNSEDDVAVFETWFPADYVFHPDDNQPAHTRSFKTHFESPNQHQGDAPGESLIAHVIYNRSATNHIRDNRLNIRQTIIDINNSFDRNKTQGWNRSIPQFPRDSIVIKPVWWHIKKSEATVLPVWDGPYEPLDNRGQYPSMKALDWPNATLVIPPGVEPPSNPQSIPGTNPNQTIRSTVPIDDFYYFEITEEMLGHLDTGEQAGFKHVSAGDYAVLIAMHVTTREIHSWVWATYWWHDRPDEGHLAEDRPDTVKNEWAHFLMNTAFSMDTPGAPDTGPHITFNPYIEGKFKNGALSNCMACHNRASLPALSENLCGALPITRGSHDYQPTSPERRTRTKLEFLWSLLIRPDPSPPKCIGSGE